MAIYSEFSHWKWWFSIVMLVYQTVRSIKITCLPGPLGPPDPTTRLLVHKAPLQQLEPSKQESMVPQPVPSSDFLIPVTIGFNTKSWVIHDDWMIWGYPYDLGNLQNLRNPRKQKTCPMIPMSNSRPIFPRRWIHSASMKQFLFAFNDTC